jgi:hypothetical protein
MSRYICSTCVVFRSDVPNRMLYAGQNQPIPGGQQLGNNHLAPSGQRARCVSHLVTPASTICSSLTRLPRLDDLPRYNPLDAWAENVSRGWDPVTFFFDCDTNGGLDSNV